MMQTYFSVRSAITNKSHNPLKECSHNLHFSEICQKRDHDTKLLSIHLLGTITINVSTHLVSVRQAQNKKDDNDFNNIN